MQGQHLGGFQVVSEIGRGGMGVVYRARQLSLERDVALKTLMPGLELDEALVGRFRAEARAAARINHPNLVQVYDVGSEGGTYYIAMELVAGESLGSLSRRAGAMDYRRAAATASQVAAGLGALHSAGIVHRDVKPSNIIVRPDGVVKITDFGVALLQAGVQRLTQDGTTVGTADYMSPEQARGEELDGRSDIYSLGVVLYQMLTAEALFAGENALAVMRKHCEEAPPSLRRARPDVSDKLAEAVARCLAKGPADRYQTAEALAGDLDHLRLELEFAALSGDTPPTGRPTVYSTRTVASLRRQRMAELGVVRRLAARLWGIVVGGWLYAEGELDREVVGLRRAAGRMERALTDLAAARQRRRELRERAAELRARAEVARRESGEAFDANEVARADELVERERACELAAVDFEAAAQGFDDTVHQLEERYTRARDVHERLRAKVELKQAQVVRRGYDRPLLVLRRTIVLALALVLVLTAVSVWAYAIWTRVWKPPEEPDRPRVIVPKNWWLREEEKEQKESPVVRRGSRGPPRAEDAASQGDLENLKYVLRVGMAKLDDKVAVVEYLLSQGVDPDTPSDASRRTALHVAARAGHVQVVEILLAHDADARLKDFVYATPLHDAALRGHREVAELLVEADAMVNSRDGNGMSPLHFAARQGHAEVVGFLLDRGALIDLAALDGRTALHFAAARDQRDTIRLLVTRGAPLNAADSVGRTALHYCAAEGHLDVVKILLAGGSDMESADRSGQTPLHMAVRAGHLSAVRAVLDAGADVGARRGDGPTPLALAASEGNDEMVEVLRSYGATE
ncbi:MAG: ankyrin repeat domain-containing protein [Planctomycetota bacterium]|jgi:ankyrin repeat protein